MNHDIHRLDEEVRLRPVTPDDAASLAVALTRSRTYMQPWEPVRPDSFYTEQGQRERLAALLADRDAGRAMPWVLADEEDRAIGAFNLNSIASLGSAVALLIFSAVTMAHFKVYRETGAKFLVLIIALIATLGTFVVFCTTTLVNEPATAAALVVILALVLITDLLWKRARNRAN